MSYLIIRKQADKKNYGRGTIMEKIQTILMLDNNKILSHTMEAVGTHSNSSSRDLGDSHSLVEVEDRGLNSTSRYCRLVDRVACMFMYVRIFESCGTLPIEQHTRLVFSLVFKNLTDALMYVCHPVFVLSPTFSKHTE
jgi:hypothetical protein